MRSEIETGRYLGASSNQSLPEILGGSEPAWKHDGGKIAGLQVGEGRHFPPGDPRGLNEAVPLRLARLAIHVVYLVEERFVGGEENCEQIKKIL